MFRAWRVPGSKRLGVAGPLGCGFAYRYSGSSQNCLRHGQRNNLQQTLCSPPLVRMIQALSVGPSMRCLSTQSDDDDDYYYDREEEVMEDTRNMRGIDRGDVGTTSKETYSTSKNEMISQPSQRKVSKVKDDDEGDKALRAQEDDVTASCNDDYKDVQACWSDYGEDSGYESEGSFETDNHIAARSLLELEAGSLADRRVDEERPLWRRLEQNNRSNALPVKDVIDAWTAEGNPLTRHEIIQTITILRRRRNYWQALKVSDWVMVEKPFGLTEMDYAIQVELMGRVAGVRKAASYVQTIPKPFQTATLYGVLLTSHVYNRNEKAALDLVHKMERLGMDKGAHMYNQLLYLYKKRYAIDKLREVVQTMEDKGIQPDIYTYNILLDVKGRMNDVAGLERVMKILVNDKAVKPDPICYVLLAKGYMLAGVYDKCERVLQRVESFPANKRSIVNHVLLKCYARLGKEGALQRMWSLMNQQGKPAGLDYTAMIESLGIVGNVKKAEELYKEVVWRLGRSSSRYNALLSVYSNLGMVKEGERVWDEMCKALQKPIPRNFHELIKLYVKAGDENKAMEALLKAHEGINSYNRNRPMYASYKVVLCLLAEKGKVKQAEKVVQLIKDAGYLCLYVTYVTLLKAYTEAGLSPYGFIDRLIGSKYIPNQHVKDEVKRLQGT